MQENMRLKALAEIYAMHSFAPFLNHIFFLPKFARILAKNCYFFRKIAKFQVNFAKISNFWAFFWQKNAIRERCKGVPFLFIGGFDSSALCRSRRELSNAYFLVKIGFDTAENEPCKVSTARNQRNAGTGRPAVGRRRRRRWIGRLR